MRLVFRVVLGCLLVSTASPGWAASSKASGGGYKSTYHYNGPGGGSITEEEVKGKDPILATGLAVLPGILIHGFGNYYAEDYGFGNRMLVMEISGLALGLWGYGLQHNPESWQRYFGGADNTEMVGYWVKASGVTFLLLSWLGDLATASDAAIQYNHEHQINFQLDTFMDGPRMMMSYRF